MYLSQSIAELAAEEQPLLADARADEVVQVGRYSLYINNYKKHLYYSIHLQ